MAYRTTITMPDELGKRLEAVKEHFNISGICQAAIETEVVKQELLNKEPKEMDDIIARLKQEKMQFHKDIRESGYNDGYESAQNMEFGDLFGLFKQELGFESEYPDFIRSQSFWDNWLAEEIEEEKERWNSAFDEDIYLIGWYEGALAFWAKVERKL